MPSIFTILGAPGSLRPGTPGLAGPRTADAVLFALPQTLHGGLTALDNAIDTAAPPPHDDACAGQCAGQRVLVSSARGPDPAQGMPQRSSSAQTGPLASTTNGPRPASAALPEPGPSTRWDAFAHKPIHFGRFS